MFSIDKGCSLRHSAPRTRAQSMGLGCLAVFVFLARSFVQMQSQDTRCMKTGGLRGGIFCNVRRSRNGAGLPCPVMRGWCFAGLHKPSGFSSHAAICRDCRAEDTSFVTTILHIVKSIQYTDSQISYSLFCNCRSSRTLQSKSTTNNGPVPARPNVCPSFICMQCHQGPKTKHRRCANMLTRSKAKQS